MNATHALGWALVHFLWQGAALAVLLSLALALTRPQAARIRYALSLLTLGAMLFAPITTALRLYAPAAQTADRSPRAAAERLQPPTVPSRHVPAPAITSDMSQRPSQPARLSALRLLVEPALPWLVALWIGGVLLLSVRLAHGWLAARRLRTTGTRLPSAALVAVLGQLAARL